MSFSSRPTPPPPPPRLLDLEITIVSAKHIKNVNWKIGNLKPYCLFWVDPERRLATKSDDSGSNKPVWNERFTLPLTIPFQDSVLTLEIFHSKPSETAKPLVATLRVPLKSLPDPDDANRIRKFELSRPSGRPQGKIRMKIGVRERPFPMLDRDYQFTQTPSSYYSSAPPYPLPSHHQTRDFTGYSHPPHPAFPPPPSPPLPYSFFPPPPSPAPSPPIPQGSYIDSAYSPYSSGYYYSSASSPPLPPRPFFDRTAGSYGGPSAPVDYSPYDHQKPRSSGRIGVGAGTGSSASGITGSLGGLSLDEGLRYEEEKIADRIGKDYAAVDSYSHYRPKY